MLQQHKIAVLIKSICVFCGSSDKPSQTYLSAAHEMGRLLAERTYQVVYGAGSTGLMGALADGALEAGGEVVGIIPTLFNTPVLAHKKLTRLEVVNTIHQRKARMIELADAFIALPGGFGTFEELFEVLTWAQIGLHNKPIGLLNTRGYFEPVLDLIQHAGREGFIYEEHHSLLTWSSQEDALLDKLTQYRAPKGLGRWLSRDT